MRPAQVPKPPPEVPPSFLVPACPPSVAHKIEHDGRFGSPIFRTPSSFTTLSLDVSDPSTPPLQSTFRPPTTPLGTTCGTGDNGAQDGLQSRSPVSFCLLGTRAPATPLLRLERLSLGGGASLAGHPDLFVPGRARSTLCPLRFNGGGLSCPAGSLSARGGARLGGGSPWDAGAKAPLGQRTLLSSPCPPVSQSVHRALRPADGRVGVVLAADFGSAGAQTRVFAGVLGASPGLIQTQRPPGPRVCQELPRSRASGPRE